MNSGKEKGYVLYDEVNELLTEEYQGTGRDLDLLLPQQRALVTCVGHGPNGTSDAGPPPLLRGQEIVTPFLRVSAFKASARPPMERA